jgi:hypothetical protein
MRYDINHLPATNNTGAGIGYDMACKARQNDILQWSPESIPRQLQICSDISYFDDYFDMLCNACYHFPKSQMGRRPRVRQSA